LASQPTASTSFVIDDNGMLYGWGRNDLGQVGNGTMAVEPPAVTQPFGIAPPQGATGWRRVSAGWGHTLGLANDDQLYACGFNGSGRLGTGRSTNELAPTRVALPTDVTGWSDVAAGGGHSLAIGSDGKVYAWGANDWGQLGIGAAGSPGSDVPVPVNLPEELGGWKAVAAGSAHSVALSQSGELCFWGRNVFGQPKGPDVISSKAPTRIPAPSGATKWRKIGAGYNHSFAIADNGKLYAWGANNDGQLGIGSIQSSDSPQAVINPATNIVEWISASGGFNSSIGLDSAGNLYIWGRIPPGESGISIAPQPRKFNPPHCAPGWKHCTGGYLHSLAIASDCRLYGWGTNDFRQIDPSSRVSYRPFAGPIFGLAAVCSDIPNTAPIVSLTTDWSEYDTPAKIRMTAGLFDCEANVAAVMIYESTNVLTVMNVEMLSPSMTVSFVWSNAAVGRYTFWAAAVDEFGLRATSAPVSVVVYLLTNGITDIRLTTNEVDLANALLAWDCGGIRVRQTIVSAPVSQDAMPLGIFQTSPPLSDGYGLAGPGIVMSTGIAGDYVTSPNRSLSTTYRYGSTATTPQEVVLDQLGPPGNNFRHYDVTEVTVHFDVLPEYDRIELKVVFGSEEFPEFIWSNFIDVFGVLLNGTNIAVVDGAPLSPNHPAMRIIRGTELDGVLAPGDDPQIVLTAQVTPGSSNNVLTFILADTADDILDTTVYLSELHALPAHQEYAMRIDLAEATPNEVTLKVTGVPCGQVVIESSIDLRDWTGISTNTPQSGFARVTVPAQGFAPSSFFRVRRVR
jgi:alpha-tubulin suppressor-like RCC1 family protein